MLSVPLLKIFKIFSIVSSANISHLNQSSCSTLNSFVGFHIFASSHLLRICCRIVSEGKAKNYATKRANNVKCGVKNRLVVKIIKKAGVEREFFCVKNKDG